MYLDIPCRMSGLCLPIRRSIVYGSNVAAASYFLVLVFYRDRYHKRGKDCMISEGKLPCDADSYWQEECEWVFCAVGLDVAVRRDVVLQTWLCKEANVRHKDIL